MKTKHWFGLAVAALVLFAVSCKNEPKVQVPMMGSKAPIMYDTDDSTDWWKSGMNKDVQDEFVSILYDAVMDGKVKAYDRCLNQYAPADIKRYFDDCDTVVMTRDGKKEFVMCRKPSMEDIHQLTFLEDWKIDTTDFHLEKFIHGVCFYISRYDTANVLLDQYPLFWIFYDRSMPMEIQAYKDCY